MEHKLATAESSRLVEITPGPFFPDRCLECPELWVDAYGGVRHTRCVDCLAASRTGRKKATTAIAQEPSAE